MVAVAPLQNDEKTADRLLKGSVCGLIFSLAALYLQPGEKPPDRDGILREWGDIA